MSTIKSSSEHLTLNADGASKDIKFQANGVEKASLSDAGLLTTSGGASLDGAVTINSSNADVDFKVGCETGADNVDTESHALFVEGSTGNVVIGSDTNTDEAVNLLVTRSGLTTMEVYASEDSSARDAMLRLHTRNNYAQCRIRFLDGSGAGTTAGEIYYNHDGDTMYFHTDGTQRAQLNSNGLCFNADTASVNALDDYEEGDYTLTVTMGSGTATLNGSYQTANYTKIGRQVHISGQFKIESVSTPSGSFSINLPFVCGADMSDQSVGNYRISGADAPSDGMSNVIYSGNGEAKANLSWNRDTASESFQPATAGSWYMIGLTYFT